MSSTQVSWSEAFEHVERLRNTRVQARLAVANMAVAVIGAGVVMLVTALVGLDPLAFRSVAFERWADLFELVNCFFMIAWATSFHMLRVHDGARYQLGSGQNRVRRTKRSDGFILIGYPIVAVLWGEFVFRGVLAARAVDARYAQRLPYGTPPTVLEHGVTEVMIAYFLVVGVVCLLVLLGIRSNPVDLEEYDRTLGKFLGARKPARPFS